MKNKAVFAAIGAKNMVKYFSQPGYGFLAKDTGESLAGRKAAFHIGIPSGMMENLQYEAVANTGDEVLSASITKD